MSERDVIFRETFLRRFSDAEERETLQRFGALVLSMAIGDERFTEGRESLTGSELAAAAADLRRVSEYLRGVAEGIEGNEVEPAEAHLAYLARRWSNQVAELTDAIEAAIAETETEGAGALRPRGPIVGPPGLPPDPDGEAIGEPTIPNRLASIADRINNLLGELKDVADTPTRGAVSTADLALCRQAEGSAALLGIARDQVREAVGRPR